MAEIVYESRTTRTLCITDDRNVNTLTVKYALNKHCRLFTL